jgi:peptidoglycan/xylan/chitin deacetylase (PgdA/CDA1 family)
VTARAAAVVLAAALATTGLVTPAWADPPTGCPAPRSGVVDQAPGSGRTVALTFDDGPSPWTPKILAVLAEYDVPATFFDTGSHDAEYPQYARAEAAAGDVVGDHTWDHRYPKEVPGGWSRSYLEDQLSRTDTIQRDLTGRPTCLFRAPGGETSPALAGVARSLRLTRVGWSVDTEDWRQPDHPSRSEVRKIVAAATGSPGRHPVVLMHAGKASHEPESVVSDYRGNTVAALPAVIEWYRSHGYRFVTTEN